MSDPLVPILGAALGLVTILGMWILGTIWAEVRKLRDGLHDLRHDVTLLMFSQGLEPTKHPKKRGD